MSRKPQAPSDATFGFAGLIVSRLLFQELPKAELGEGESPSHALNAAVNLGYGIDESGSRAEVRFAISMDPDPREKPYHIELEVVGQFTQKTGSLDAFKAFCHLNAPTILFPYVREIVHRVTQDARYGPIRMDPINISRIIEKQSAPDRREGATKVSST